MFRSTNSGGGSGKVPLSLSLIFPSFNFLNKKEDFLIFCIVLGFCFLLIKKLNSLLYLGKKIMWNLLFDTDCVQVKRQQKNKICMYTKVNDGLPTCFPFK